MPPLKKEISYFFVLLTLFFTPLLSIAQVISSTPLFPIENDSVTILYDAALGNKELMNVAPPIYAHTGVITNLSTSPTDWKYVVANWNENLPKAQMTPLGNNKYLLKIEPSIRNYYNVPATEQIEKMAFVFRNADGSKVGRNADGSDFFVDVYPPVLSVNIVEPVNHDLSLKQNDSIIISAISPIADTLKIFVNGVLVKTQSGQYISDTILADNFGQNWIKHWVRILAKNDSASAADSFSYTILPPAKVASLPPGMVDGINYIDASTALLCLYAPGKNNVFAIGDFNDWQVDSNYYLNITPDSKRYWIQLNNLVPKQEYIFQYLVDGTLRIGDPYADKVSDPDDQYIQPATYPNLKPYPTGKTTNIATYLQTAQDPYPWQSGTFNPPPVTNLVIYELLIRDFTTKHDYPSLIDTLNYLKKLGINAIELMPVMEFEGNNSWGYNPDFSFAPDKYYGTKNGLKQFVEAAHAKGIAVILDIVCNHHFGNSPLVRLYWNNTAQRPASDNPWFNEIPKHPFNVGLDFNHDSPSTKAYMERLVRYWISEFHVDGYRFDLSKGFTQVNSYPNNSSLMAQYDPDRVAILKNYSNVIHSVNPKAYVILEHFADNSEETELSNNSMMLWGNMNGSYIAGAGGWNTNGNSDFSGASYKKRGWTNPALVAYMESHDEERVMYKNITAGNSTKPPYNIKDTTTGLTRVELNANFFFTIPGPKMFWQFGELGYDYSINYPSGTSSSRLTPKPIRWDYMNQYRRRHLNYVFSSLIDLKKTQPVFQTGTFTIDSYNAIKRMWLQHSSMDATILGNFDVIERNVVPNFTKTGTWFEFYSGDSLVVTDIASPLTFSPGEYRLYTTTRLPRPVFTGIEETPSVDHAQQIKVVASPNPSSGLWKLSFQLSERVPVSIVVYNVYGKIVKTVSYPITQPGFQQVDLDLTKDSGNQANAGIYLFVIRAGSLKGQGKLIIH